MGVNFYNKRASVSIDGKLFENDPSSSNKPFSIEFEVTQDLNGPAKSKVRLYNPNDNTIGKCDLRKEGKKTIYPFCQFSGGYVDNFGVVGNGFIKKYDVIRKGRDRILEIEIHEDKNFWGKRIKDSSGRQRIWKNTRASVILDQILVGREKDILLGEDVLIDSFSAKNVYLSMIKLAAITKSHWSLLNGIAKIQPFDFQAERAFKLDYDSGLVGTPEKITKPSNPDETAYNGYRIKTLFIYGLELFSFVDINIPGVTANGVKKKDLRIQGKVRSCIRPFSTFSNATSTYEIRPI